MTSIRKKLLIEEEVEIEDSNNQSVQESNPNNNEVLNSVDRQVLKRERSEEKEIKSEDNNNEESSSLPPQQKKIKLEPNQNNQNNHTDPSTSNSSTIHSNSSSSNLGYDQKPEPSSFDVENGTEDSFDAPPPPLEDEPEPVQINSGPILCPYLDTINRNLLDFDFNKVCSVSLSSQNVYACLVCGKYYSGRGKNTHAYVHSLDHDHHVFIHLKTAQVFCLPDNYLVEDPSLDDIKYNLHPTFTDKDLNALTNNSKPLLALDGSIYLPGLVGLNNISHSDWLNSSVQLLARVIPLRNYLIKFQSNQNNPNNVNNPSNQIQNKNHHVDDSFVNSFAELMGKLCNSRAFKSHVSPHSLLQSVVESSKVYSNVNGANSIFSIGQNHDPIQFLSFALNHFHKYFSKGIKSKSIVHSCFQGIVRQKISKTPERIHTDRQKLKIEQEKAQALKQQNEDEPENENSEKSIAAKPKRKVKGIHDIPYDDHSPVIRQVPFLYLSLNLPPAPLFKDKFDKTIIPQIPLPTLLSKFNNSTVEYTRDGLMIESVLTSLPEYLIIHYQRFNSNNWFVDKNPTLVTFPIKGLDMSPYFQADADAASINFSLEELKQMKMEKLKKLAKQFGPELLSKVQSSVEKEEVVQLLHQAIQAKLNHKDKPAGPSSGLLYDLVGNLVHDGTPKNGSWRAHILHTNADSAGTWYELNDLRVWTTETMPQLVALSEAYIQIYKRV